MQQRRTQTKNKRVGVKSPILDFLERYWLIILGITFIFPTFYKWLVDIIATVKQEDDNLKVEANSAENAIKSPEIQKSKADKILYEQYKLKDKTVGEKVKADAIALVHHLGTEYAWYEPKSWTENDLEVEKILKRQVHNFRVLESLYFSVYTQSRSLSDDILKTLDKSNLENVRKFWANHAKKWL